MDVSGGDDGEGLIGDEHLAGGSDQNDVLARIDRTLTDAGQHETLARPNLALVGATRRLVDDCAGDERLLPRLLRVAGLLLEALGATVLELAVGLLVEFALLGLQVDLHRVPFGRRNPLSG